MTWFVASMVMATLAACGGGGGGDTGVEAPVLPVIVAQPTDVGVVEGSEARFTVTATNATGYQWQRGSVAGGWNDISGAVSASLVMPAVSLSDDQAQFRAIVRGDGGTTLTSSSVTLTVTAAVIPPSISAQPSGQTVIEGQQAVFSVTASGSALQYAWQSSADDANWRPVSGGDAASLVLAAVTADDNGQRYRVIVSNTVGQIASASALLRVDPVPQSPSITRSPVDAAVTVGATASFSATAVGQPAPTLQWQGSPNGVVWTDIPGAQGSSLTTPPVAQSDNGSQFRVVARNASGSVTSEAATLRVSPVPVAPRFTAQPQGVAVLAGAPASFVVQVEGTPRPSVQWQLKTASVDWVNLNGETRLSLVIPAADLSFNGNRYRAIASSSAGSVASAEAILGVNATPPIFTVQPRPASVVAPQPATFSVAVSAAPAAALQWQTSADGVHWSDVAGANAASYTVAATNVLRDNDTLYRVVASNPVNVATSAEARLTVAPAPAARFCAGSGGSGWCWANPRPQGGTLRGIAKAGFGSYVAVGALGHIQRTVDRGLTWTNVLSPELRNLNAVDFADDRVGIAVGDGGALLRSVDGGQHWSAVASGVAADLTAVSFGSPTVALAVGANGSMLRSADAGQSWQPVNSGTSVTIRAVAWADENTVAIVAGEEIRRSADAGRTWAAVWSSFSARFGFDGIAFSTPTVGFAMSAASGSPIALRTTDGGSSWTQVAAGSGRPLVVFSGLHGYLLGGGLAPLQSWDGGATWSGTSGSMLLNTTLLAAAFESDNVGLTVGTGGVVQTLGNFTEPGGAAGFRDHIRALAFADERTAVAVTAPERSFDETGSWILRSTDGGNSWSRSDGGGPSAYSLLDLAFADAGTAVAVGRMPGSGVILRSADGGLHWTRVRTLPDVSLSGVALRSQLGLAVAVRGADARAVVYRSTDQGRTWAFASSPSGSMLNGVALAGDTSAVAVGAGGQIVRTTDAGVSWQAVASPTTKDLKAVAFSAQGVGLAVGADGTVLRSQDAGATWSVVSVGATRNLSSVALRDNEAYAVGEGGLALSSVDAGATWTSTATGADGLLSDVASNAAGSAVLVGDAGAILTTTTAGRGALSAAGPQRKRVKSSQ